MAENSNGNVAQKQPSFRIKSISVTVEVADKEYGNGNSGHATISAYVDDAGLEQIDDVVDAGLSMFVAGWETVIGGKVAARMFGMGAQELQDVSGKIRKRLTKVRELLRNGRAA
jgi:hypothetical protein